jgi:hypothetical protein
MKLNSKLAECSLDQLDTALESFITSEYFDQVVAMRFLEESAKYFGVYVENKQDDLPDVRDFN